MFKPYERGRHKLWYGLKTVSRPYALVLLPADALFDRGLCHIPHGRSDVDYKRFLRGDFRLVTPALADGDLLPDIEEGPQPAVAARVLGEPAVRAANLGAESEGELEQGNILATWVVSCGGRASLWSNVFQSLLPMESFSDESRIP